ncbi:MAG: hypothetical protein NDI61_08115 [Bdellovibrionaceae bacterium]|nr:hypothetical protein [Pseudobdellovibrionaceae bacterium]
MIDISQLRTQLRAVSPTDVLDHLSRLLQSPGLPADFENPILTICMRSGTTFRGYLVTSGHSTNETEPHFLISLEVKNERDDMRDIAYVNGADIEAVFIFDVDTILNQLPMRDA